jgi:hypothetical protein
MVPENREICEARSIDMEESVKEFTSFNQDMTTIMDFEKWADKHLNIQSTYVKDYADHIREWTERGTSRWETVAE